MAKFPLPKETTKIAAIIMHVLADDPEHRKRVVDLAIFFPHVQLIAVSEEAGPTALAQWGGLRERFKNLRFIVIGVPLGKGAALRAGLNQCDADLVAFLDLDGVVAMRSIDNFFNVLNARGDVDGIVGNRWSKESTVKTSLKRKIASRLFDLLARAVFGLPVSDPQAPLKVFRRDLLMETFGSLRLFNHGFDVELLFHARRLGATLNEMPLAWTSAEHRWPLLKTAIHVVVALGYIRILNSPLARIPLVDLIGRPHSLPVKRSYSIMIFCWRDPSHPQAGGAEVYLHEQAKVWAERGHRVTWFAQRHQGSRHEEITDGIKFVRWGVFPWVFLLAPLWYLLKSGREYDFLIDCMNGIPFFTPLYSTKPKVCLLYHVHTHHFKEELPRFTGFLASAVETRLTPLIYRNTRFVTISESSKAEIEEHHIARLPITLIYGGVSPELIPRAKAIQPTILYLGRLKKYKRVRKLLDAFAKVRQCVPTARLVIAGTGDDEQDLRNYVETAHFEGVEFRGRVDEITKIKLMQEAWVFGMPSSLEGWGIVIIEANACATPSVVYRVPGLRDCVLHRQTGFIADDDDEFTSYLIAMLTDADLLACTAEGAYSWSKRFSWESTAENTLTQIRLAQPWRAVFEPGHDDHLELRIQPTGSSHHETRFNMTSLAN